jgi:hypothetical protein
MKIGRSIMKNFLRGLLLIITVCMVVLLGAGEVKAQVEYGIAAKYPYDQGIKNDPAVIHAIGFERPDWAEAEFGTGFYMPGPEYFARCLPCNSSCIANSNLRDYTGFTLDTVFDGISGQCLTDCKYCDRNYSPPRGNSWNTTNPEGILDGIGSLERINIEGTHYPGIYHMTIAAHDKLYLRWYRKFESGYKFWGYMPDGSVKTHAATKASGLYARGPRGYYGGRPTGYNAFSLKLQNWQAWDDSNGFETQFYTYNPEQTNEFGDSLPQNIGEVKILKTGVWNSFEIMLKANDAGVHNGEIKMWLNGELKGHYTGLRFRDTNDLKINELDLNAYFGGEWTAYQDQKLWDENVVIATQYIGPMVTQAQVTPTPKPNEVIVDNEDAGFSYFTAQGGDPWVRYPETGTLDGQHYNGSHYYNIQAGNGDKAMWSFSVPEPGVYEAYAWWWAVDSGPHVRPSQVPYTINTFSNKSTVWVDQRYNGGQWNLLGEYAFIDDGEISVSDDVVGQNVIADAVRLVKVGELQISLPKMLLASWRKDDFGLGSNNDGKVNSWDWTEVVSNL